MKNKNNVAKSRSLKSYKATLQKKCNKDQEKRNFLFTDRNDDIDSYPYGDLTNMEKVIIKRNFWVL